MKCIEGVKGGRIGGGGGIGINTWCPVLSRHRGEFMIFRFLKPRICNKRINKKFKVDVADVCYCWREASDDLAEAVVCGLKIMF